MAEQTKHLDVLTARINAFSSSSDDHNDRGGGSGSPAAKRARTADGGGNDGHGFIVGADGYVQVFTDGATSFNGQKSNSC